MACAFIANFLLLHGGVVGWFLVSAPFQPNSWINALNVPLTFALMIGGAAAGARPSLRAS
jgi:hypothetical protein